MLKPHGTRCSKTVQPRLSCLPAGKPAPPVGPPVPAPAPGPPPAPPPLVPKWPPTFNMSESTVVMPCNYTGLYDYDVYPDLAKFGLVDYDWSNAKKTWANQSPMDADGVLVKQAARNKAANPSAKVFVYRNIVKALVRQPRLHSLAFYSGSERLLLPAALVYGGEIVAARHDEVGLVHSVRWLPEQYHWRIHLQEQRDGKSGRDGQSIPR